MTAATCPRCGGELVSRRIPAGQERSGPVTAAADPHTVRACLAGCAAIDTDLEAALDGALTAGLPFANGTPHDQRCAACSARLDLPMRATLRAVTVAPTGSPPFTVTFGLPFVRCGECGTDNVPPGVADDVRTSGRAACGLPPTRQRTTLLRRLLRRGGPGSL